MIWVDLDRRKGKYHGGAPYVAEVGGEPKSRFPPSLVPVWTLQRVMGRVGGGLVMVLPLQSSTGPRGSMREMVHLAQSILSSCVFTLAQIRRRLGG